MTTQSTSTDKLQRIQIADLPDDATEVTIRALFLAHGPVASYARPVHALTGRPGPYAYIEMAPADAAKAIKALNGHRIGTRALSVRLGAPPAAWVPGADRSARSPRPRRIVTETVADAAVTSSGTAAAGVESTQ